MKSLFNKNRLYFQKDLQIIFCITLMAIMGVTSIAPVFPKISEELGISAKEVALLITFFTFPGIFLSPVLGVFADRVGRKKILVPSIILFGIAGSACAFTKNFNLILALRFFQGVGAASLGSLNLTIIGDIYTDNDRIHAMGYNSSIIGIGAMIYPAIGGVIALLGWNYPFLLAALAFPVAFLVAFGLNNPEPDNNQHILHYLKNAARLFLNVRTITIYTATLATFILLYGALLAYFPFYMKRTFDSPPSEIGLILATASLATSIGAFNLARISRYVPPGKMIGGAFLLYAVAIFITMHIENIYLMAVPVLIYGFANGINIPTIQNQLSGSAPMEYRGSFMSINSMVLRLGQTLGPVLGGLAFALWDLDGVFYSSVVFSLVISFFILAVIREKAGP